MARTVEIQDVRVELDVYPGDHFATKVLMRHAYQRLFDDIRDEVVREMYDYGVAEEHLSELSARVTKVMMNKSLRLGKMRC